MGEALHGIFSLVAAHGANAIIFQHVKVALCAGNGLRGGGGVFIRLDSEEFLEQVHFFFFLFLLVNLSNTLPVITSVP